MFTEMRCAQETKVQEVDDKNSPSTIPYPEPQPNKPPLFTIAVFMLLAPLPQVGCLCSCFIIFHSSTMSTVFPM